MGHGPSCSSASSVMSPQHQPDPVSDDEAGHTKSQQDREKRVHTLTPKEPLSPAAGISLFENLRSIFISSDRSPISASFEYKSWHNDDIQCRAMAISAACELSQEKPIMAEPLQDGRLIIHSIVPENYPGGKEAFSSTSIKFIRKEETFGIAHIYYGEDNIAAFLKMVSESYKEHWKSLSTQGNRGSKGKAIKWKNPATAFGCRYVWAHDRATPHLMYFRVRSVWMDLPALAVVDTTHDEYKFGLSANKEKFVQYALPQIHLGIILKNYNLLFQKSSREQSEVPHDECDPAQSWWWSIVQEHKQGQHNFDFPSASEPAVKSQRLKEKTEAVVATSDSSTIAASQPMRLEESGAKSFENNNPKIAQGQDTITSVDNVPLSTEAALAIVQNKDAQGKEDGRAPKVTDSGVLANTKSKQSQLTKAILTKDKGLKENETSQSQFAFCDKQNDMSKTHGYESVTTKPLLESKDEPILNGADIGASEDAAARKSVAQMTASAETGLTAGTFSADEKSDDAVTSNSNSSKTKKKKKSKNSKKRNVLQRVEQADLEKGTAVDNDSPAAGQSGLATDREEDKTWRVVTHNKKHQASTEPKTHESSSQEDGQSLSNMTYSRLPNHHSNARAPPPLVNDVDFPRLPVVPENSTVNHKSSTSSTRTYALGRHFVPSPAASNNGRTGSSRNGAPIPVVPAALVKPLSPPVQPRVRARGQVDQGSFIQLDSTDFPCAKADCSKTCRSLDYTSVICPRCGPLSRTRYCSKIHLLSDAKYHWIMCGQDTFTVPVRGSLSLIESPPLMPSFYMWDNIERFRLALHHAVDLTGDYFVFRDHADYLDYVNHRGVPQDGNAIVPIRCSSEIVHKVSFTDPVKKDRFRRVLGVCLMLSPVELKLVSYLFRMIRDNMRERGTWSDKVHRAIVHQMSFEFGTQLQDFYVGERHACEAEWIGGLQRRGCKDETCLMESRIGMAGERLQQHTEDLEANFWILRAHRYTHPDIPGMTKEAIERRTRGEGFPGVYPEDKRLFARGPGWDHGAAELEIEDYEHPCP